VEVVLLPEVAVIGGEVLLASGRAQAQGLNNFQLTTAAGNSISN